MKKILKSKLFFFLLGAVIFSTVSVFAYDLFANNIGLTTVLPNTIFDLVTFKNFFSHNINKREIIWNIGS